MIRSALKAPLKVTLGCARHPIQTLATLRAAGNSELGTRDQHLQRAVDWLLLSQSRAPDGKGYSRRFRLVSGWDRCYIETTGYIIPSLYDAGSRLRRPECAASAAAAGDWLLQVQQKSGAFCEIDNGTPQVFDTGQVLLGLNRLYRESGNEDFLCAAERAAAWLVAQQDADGAWRRSSYNERPHAYYSRVAAALLDTGLLTGEKPFQLAAERNLDWVLAQESENGYFRYSEFRPGEDALLHTLVYVVEGFILANEAKSQDRWRDAALRGVRSLAARAGKDGLLRSQYDNAWAVTNNEFCVTGLAQFAGACFDAFQLSGDASLVAIGTRVLDQLCRWQLRSGRDITGALPSSVPVWGYYGGMEFFNWNTKFFVDALLKEQRAERD